MKDWKTTLAGVGGAVLIVVANWLQTGNLTDWKALATAAVAAAIGFFAGDSKKEG